MDRRLPAEFEPVSGVFLGWPHCESDWPGKFGAIPHAFLEVLRLVLVSVPVQLLVRSAAEQAQAKHMIKRAGLDLGRITFLQVPSDRNWLRDTSCIPVKVAGEETAPVTEAICWDFNGWGYLEHERDARIPETLARLCGWKPVPAVHDGRRVTLEGGAYDVNGAGSILTTRHCLLDATEQPRNAAFTEDDYRRIFDTYLGAPHIIWIDHGIAGDGTHGHVDLVARFVDKRTIVTAVESDPADENHRPLRDNLEQLRAARDPDGHTFEIIELPMPGPVKWDDERLAASYLNFLILNDRVIVPTFNDPQDRVALGILQEATGRRAVGCHSVDMILGGGCIHCLSHQIPA